MENAHFSFGAFLIPRFRADQEAHSGGFASIVSEASTQLLPHDQTERSGHRPGIPEADPRLRILFFQFTDGFTVGFNPNTLGD